MLGKNTYLQAPKCSKLGVTDMRQKPVDLFIDATRAPTLSPAMI